LVRNFVGLWTGTLAQAHRTAAAEEFVINGVRESAPEQLSGGVIAELEKLRTH
jgi:hypothetical protein